MKVPGGGPQREVLPQGQAAPFQRSSANAGDFGALEAEALAKSGAQGMQTADDMARAALAEQGLKNEAEAKDADIKATERLVDLQYNPDSGFMNTKGKNAVDGYRSAADAAKQIRTEILGELKSPEAKRMADRVLATRVQSALQSMASHTGVENRSWQLGTSDARAITAVDAASLEYNNDARFEQALKTARSEALSQSEMQGWGGPDAPQTKIRIKQYEDAGWAKRYERWQQHDPTGALANFQRNAERMSPELSAKLSESLFKAAAPVLAAGLNATGGPPITASEIGRKAPGQVEPGNIDLGKRPVVKNKDGSVSTIRSMSFNEEGREILVPTISDDGAQLTEQQAIDAYRTTGRHLGKFDTPENATAYAKRLSNEQGKKVAAEPSSRGVRNNNPGNIIQGPTKWQGEIEGADPRYASFKTPEDGIRALGKNLLAYGDRGLTTVDGIINRWAPPVENDTKGYVATVAKELGVDPQQPLNLRDRKVLTGLATAIIKVENGKAASAYTPEQIAMGISAAMDGKPIPSDPKVIQGPGGAVAQPQMVTSIANMTATDVLTVRTGNPTIDNLPADQKIQVFHLARTQANQGIAQAREALKGRVIDTAAALERGMDAPNRPNPSELISVFGQYEGMKIDQELGNAAAFGNDVRAVGTMPLSQQMTLLATRAPQPGEGFANAEKRQEQLARAIDKVNTERTQDPSLAVLRTSPAVQASFANLSKLMSQNGDPAATAAASQAYAAASLAEQQRLEIQNPQVLPKTMVDQIAKRFASPPGEGADTASVMRGMVDQWGKYWPMVGKQLGQKIPPGAVVIGLGVKPEAEQLISEALKLKPEQLRQGILPEDQKALKELVTKQFEPLQRGLAWQAGGQETYDNYVDTAAALAILLMQKGVKPKVAAEKAFESMVGYKYEFEDTWRVPKGSLTNTLTPNLIRGGAHAAKFDIAEAAPLRIPAPTGGAVRPEDQEKQWRNQVQDVGFWVTSPGDGGLTLYVKSGLGAQPVLNKDGSPVRRSWSELGALGDGVRAARYTDVYKKGVRGP